MWKRNRSVFEVDHKERKRIIGGLDMKKWIQPIQAATGNPDEVKKHGNAEVELDDIIDTNPAFVKLVDGFKPPNMKGEITDFIQLRSKGNKTRTLYGDIDENQDPIWIIRPAQGGTYTPSKEVVYEDLLEACRDFSNWVWDAFDMNEFSQIEIRQSGPITYFY